MLQNRLFFCSGVEIRLWSYNFRRRCAYFYCVLQLSLCRSYCNGCVKVASCCGYICNTIVFCSWISEIVLEWLHEGYEINLLADFLYFGTNVVFVARRFRAVWSVGRKECSVKCEVWRNQWEVRSVKCGVWSVKCEVSVWSVKSAVWSVKCEVWSVKFEVWSAKSAVWSVECEDFASSLAEKIKRLSREGHGRDRVSLNYRSFMFGKLPPPACPGLCYQWYLMMMMMNLGISICFRQNLSVAPSLILSLRGDEVHMSHVLEAGEDRWIIIRWEIPPSLHVCVRYLISIIWENSHH